MATAIMSAATVSPNLNAGIEAGRDHVDQCVIDDDLDADVGIALEKARHDRQQHQLGRLPRGVEAQRAGRLAAKIVEVFERIVDIAECRTDARKQPLARFGQRDAARGAVDQPQIEPLLDIAQRVAQRRAETPSSVAAARKLRCRAIARKVARSEGSIRIDEFFSVACRLFSGLSQIWRAAILAHQVGETAGRNGKGNDMRVWFITGASRGFGALIAEAALKAGDAVVATARDPNTVTARLGAMSGCWRRGSTSPARPRRTRPRARR